MRFRGREGAWDVLPIFGAVPVSAPALSLVGRVSVVFRVPC